jgi:glycosyltransferase involved in cell wall biosynthesis/SAM-dependent methyltransferase
VTSARPCWCGNADLVPFNTDYLRCTRCETLVFRHQTPAVAGRVRHDDSDYYGRDYWFGHQQALGLVDIRTRSRRDLSERCLHWLRTVLRYRRPPGRTLELGCSHGGFVALLRSVGFDARGLELSPSIAEFARQTFGVSVAVGPVEDQAFEIGALDIVLAMDVLEHLGDPQKTFERCAERLRSDGLIVVQTPCYPEGQTYEELQSAGSPFLAMLLPEEHIYLFSRTSIRALFERVGFRHVAFEPAIFDGYDMFVVASGTPLTTRPETEAVATLTETGTMEPRLVLGLLDLDRERAALTVQLRQVEVEASARLQNTVILEALLAEANADRAARLELLQGAEQQFEAVLQEANADRAARLTQIQELERQLQEANADRAARLGLLQERAVSEQQLEQMLDTTREALMAVRAEFDELRTKTVAPRTPRVALSLLRHKTSPERPLVAVDVTPILPGSENGGAKAFVLELLQGFAKRGRHRYLILTTPVNHESFAAFEQTGMTRLCLAEAAAQARWPRLGGRLQQEPRRGAGTGPLHTRGADLLFCPMTDPVHVERGIPTVCTVYDLQHLAYPSFFTAEERANRDAFLNRVRHAASAVVCISEFTRGDVISRLGLGPERVWAIPIAVHSRLVPPSEEAVQHARTHFGLGDAPYAFYPANGWPHKNHRLLLVGFAQLVAERPEIPLHLVLVGNLLQLAPELQEAVVRMGLAERVHLLGFVSDEELSALWRGAFCLLFPSLYEGFGMPLLEAMQFGTPIVCSQLASLSEVGGEAARYIDPRRPADIGVALQELFDQPALRRALIERGGQQLKSFRSAHMVERYLGVFDEVRSRGVHVLTPSVEGVFGDRWLGRIVTAVAGASHRQRVWDFEIHIPDWHPHPTATVVYDLDGRKRRKLHLKRGQTRHLQIDVPPAGGEVRLDVSPSFIPRANGDFRELTVQLVRCQLRESKSGEVVYEV